MKTNAGKKTETAVEKSAPEETAMAVGEFDDLMEHAGQGTEGIEEGSVRPPRLLLAQSGTPQAKLGDPKQIEGLREGEYFNDLTEGIYPKGPLKVVFINCLGERGVEFADLETEGGGIIDADVPLDDPRMQFRPNPENPKKRLKPVATRFMDYLIFLPDTQELATFSFKGTGIKVGQKLNSMLKYMLKVEGKTIMNPPAWARTFTLGVSVLRNEKFSWVVPVIKADGVTDKDTRSFCAMLYEAHKHRKIEVPIEANDVPSDSAEMPGGDATFDPASMS